MANRVEVQTRFLTTHDVNSDDTSTLVPVLSIGSERPVRANPSTCRSVCFPPSSILVDVALETIQLDSSNSALDHT